MIFNLKRFIQFIIAINLMALGINFYLFANIGIGSWDILHNNLTEFYGFTFGTWIFIVGIITIFISQIFYVNLKGLYAIITGYILGLIVDIWLYNVFIFEFSNMYFRGLYFFIGIILLGSGISLLVLSTLPPTPPDILMVSLMKKFNINFLKAKSIVEGFIFIVAVIVGIINDKPFNNIGIGTIIYLLLIGSIVQISSKIWKKIFKIV